MEFGFGVPDSGPVATPDNIATVARGGEEMGFGLISVSDHLVMPKTIDSIYPYNDSGAWPGGTDCLEMLTTMGFLAGQTSKAKLVSAVMVLPYRDPIFTAKILATIDVLCNGRLILGCGVGWMEEEFQALGSPPFEERGAISDEYLAAFKELWTSDNPTFDGKYCSFSDINFEPKPVQKPHPPLWIGGESPPALRRTARLGDAWFPIGNNPRFPVDTKERLVEYRSRIRSNAEKIGRDPDEIGIAYYPATYNPHETENGPDGERSLFTGNPQQVADDIKAFEEVGVQTMMFPFFGETVDAQLSEMDLFATRIMPLASN